MMSMNDISVGDTVEVFQKPFTKEQWEGWAVSFFKGKFDGHSCYYMNHSAIEYIYVI